MNSISVYSFTRPNKAKNFGDDLSLSMCEYASGKSVVWENPKYADMYAVGSLLQIFKSRKRQIKLPLQRALKRKKRLVIWGTGVIKDMPLHMPPTTVLAVRGPLTANALGLKTTVPFGDPGLLVSDILAAPKKIGKIGIVPHYVDKTHPVVAEAGKNDRFMIIDVEDDWTNAVSRIAQCDLILSSSLHGLIVADAYSIPNQWLEFSNQVVGNGFKFQDYVDGIGRSSMKRVEVVSLNDIAKAVGMAQMSGPSLGDAQLRNIKDDLKRVLHVHYQNN